MTHPPEREIGRELQGAMHHSTGSYELVIAALAAAGLGFWIDSVLGIVPVLTLVFAFAGFVGAGYSIYLRYQEQMAVENEARLARKARPSNVARAASDSSDPTSERGKSERSVGTERPEASPAVSDEGRAPAAKQGSEI